MSPFRISLAVIAACLSAAASAAPLNIPVNTGNAATGNTNWNSSNIASNYGNSYAWTVGGVSITATGWGTSATTSTSAFQKAFIGNYDPNGLGMTSQATGELSGNSPNTATGQHALDNIASYEALSFAFSSAVTLNSLTVGWQNTSNSDATMLAYTGLGTPPSIEGKSLSDLLGSGWTIASNVFDMATGTAKNVTNVAGALSSKYWLVGAFMAVGGQASGSLATQGSQGDDAFKVSGLAFSTTSTGQAVPEPDSVALFGIAALGLFLARRKARAKA